MNSSTPLIEDFRSAVRQRHLRAVVGGLMLIVITALLTRAAHQSPTVTVLTASHDLDSLTPITKDDIAVIRIPKGAEPPLLVKSRGEIIGHSVLGRMAKHEIFTQTRIQIHNSASTDTATVAVASDFQSAAMLEVGDLVDVYAIDDSGQPAKVVGHSVQVLGLRRASGVDSNAMTVFLAAPAVEVTAIMTARMRAQLSLALRGNYQVP